MENLVENLVENLGDPILPSFDVSRILRGTSYQRASLYGMPHVGCDGKSITGACTVCGLRATERHHAAPKGTGGRYLTVPTQNGALKLESALLALCHGCHDRFPPQGFEYSVEWRWHDVESCDAWWSGDLIASGIEPHSPELFAYGFYVVRADRVFTVAEW